MPNFKKLFSYSALALGILALSQMGGGLSSNPLAGVQEVFAEDSTKPSVSMNTSSPVFKQHGGVYSFIIDQNTENFNSIHTGSIKSITVELLDEDKNTILSRHSEGDKLKNLLDIAPIHSGNWKLTHSIPVSSQPTSNDYVNYIPNLINRTQVPEVKYGKLSIVYLDSDGNEQTITAGPQAATYNNSLTWDNVLLQADPTCVVDEAGLQTALAGTGDTITICKDITLTDEAKIKNSVTINGNGHTITSTNNKYSIKIVKEIEENAEITINDLTIKNEQKTAIKVESTASLALLALDNLTLDGHKSIYIADGNTQSTVGNFSLTNSHIISNYPLYIDHQLTTLKIEDNIFSIKDGNRGIVFSQQTGLNDITIVDNTFDITEATPGKIVMVKLEPLNQEILDGTLNNNIFPNGSKVIEDESGIVYDATYCVFDETQLNTKLNNSELDRIDICADFEITSKKDINHEVVINGNNHTLSYNDADGWNSAYFFHFYKTTGAVNNLTFDGGDAAMFVNGSNVTIENLTLKNGEFGGIEVSQGQEVEQEPVLTINGSLNYDEQAIPVIRIDEQIENAGWVVNYTDVDLREVIMANNEIDESGNVTPAEYSDTNEESTTSPGQVWFIPDYPAICMQGDSLVFDTNRQTTYNGFEAYSDDGNIVFYGNGYPIPLSEEDIPTCTPRSSGGGGGGYSIPTPTEPEQPEEIVLGGEVDELFGHSYDLCSITDSNYNDEMNQAYLYACSYDITTIRHINDTRLEDTLTRAEFAKIISNYVRYNLDREPDTSRVANFSDSDEVNSELAGYVEMAYQYGLMGINMPDNRFLVNDTISRAEVSTILSRLYELALDGTGDTPYYRPHMDAMLDAGFITLDDPTLSEVRGYLFIMLERIAEAYLGYEAN